MESRMIYSGRPKESRPKISFVIPTYKRARFLENAIDSILCQENTEIPSEKLDEIYKCKKDWFITSKEAIKYKRQALFRRIHWRINFLLR